MTPKGEGAEEPSGKSATFTLVRQCKNLGVALFGGKVVGKLPKNQHHFLCFFLRKLPVPELEIRHAANNRHTVYTVSSQSFVCLVAFPSGQCALAQHPYIQIADLRTELGKPRTGTAGGRRAESMSRIQGRQLYNLSL